MLELLQTLRQDLPTKEEEKSKWKKLSLYSNITESHIGNHPWGDVDEDGCLHKAIDYKLVQYF